MTSLTTKSDSSQPAAETASRLFDNWFDPIETEVRARSRQFIEELIRSELDAVLARRRPGGCGNGAMVEPLRHRQTKGAATNMFYLTPPRHISTLPKAPF